MTNKSVVIGTTQKLKRILDYWVTKAIPIQTEVNMYLQNRPLNGLEIVDYEDEKGNVVKNTATYFIDSNAKWSDGVDITSEDYRFWLEVKKNPCVPVYIREPWSNAQISIIDNKKFEITFEPAYLFVENNAPLVAPAHLLKKSWHKWYEQAKNITDEKELILFWETWLDSFTSISSPPTVTNGAFIIQEWTTEILWLVRNQNYYEKFTNNPSIEYAENIIYRFFSNTDEMVKCAMDDGVDVLSLPGLLQTDDLEDYSIFEVETYNWEHIDFNMFNSARSVSELEFNNPLIRKALAHSIDRTAIVNRLYSKKGIISNSFVHHESSLYDQGINEIEYNPQLALKIFNDLGWVRGKDGILTKDKIQFNPKISTILGSEMHEIVQSMIVDNLLEIGVIGDVANYTFIDFLNIIQRGEEGAFDLLLFSWDCDPNFEKGDLYSERNFSESNIPSHSNDFKGLNVGGWINKDYSSLFLQAQQEFDENTRINMFQNMQNLWKNELPSIPLFFKKKVFYVKRGLRNFSCDIKNREVEKIGWNKIEIETQD